MNTPANKRPGVVKDTHSGLIDLNTTSAPRNAEIAPEAPTVTTGGAHCCPCNICLVCDYVAK